MTPAPGTDKSTFRRVLDGLGGQLVSRAALFLNTLGVVPLLLGSWGLTAYGEWVALTAIATLISFSNFGLANAASTEIVRASAASDGEQSQRVFATALAALGLIFIPVIVAVYVASSLIPIGPLLKVTHIDATGIIVITMAMAFQVWINTVKGLFFGVTFSAGRYGAPNFVSGAMRLVELLALVVIVGLLGQPPVAAALTIASVAAVDLIIQAVLAKRSVTWLSLRRIAIHPPTLRFLIGPSIGIALLHLGVNFIGVQGPRIVLSAIAGPAAVGLFSVYATANRVIDQVSALLMSVVQLEFSRSSGAGDSAQTARLIAITGQVAIASFTVLALGLLIGGPMAFEVWTHGDVVFHYPLAIVFLIFTLIAQTAKTPLTYLMGANQLLWPVMGILASGVVGLGIGALFAQSWGPLGMAIGQVAAEGLALLVVVGFVSRSIRVNPVALVISQYQIVSGFRRLAGPMSSLLRAAPFRRTS
ncbi:MAG: hypothetical protein KKA16_14505 [Alphaproteobacteria bacterium]|nr:hypothetical protein [Alphaproteobacteria bacterium]MBU2378741.1 hypothetical protein [Alphaproteobacteria bacterium]